MIELHGSYLQGMETAVARPLRLVGFLCTDPTYKEWKQLQRNPNIDYLQCTDPTYKEWKLGTPGTPPNLASHCTDPTYKEWKLSCCCLNYRPCHKRTDPTYKEWKQKIAKERPQDIRARILPTRNGNGLELPITDPSIKSTDPTYKEWKLRSRGPRPVRRDRHGSYLQGMETTGRGA